MHAVIESRQLVDGVRGARAFWKTEPWLKAMPFSGSKGIVNQLPPPTLRRRLLGSIT
jgi:hypothetical protein